MSAGMNASEQKVLADVQAFGWHVVLIPEDDAGPGFAFTIGLFQSFRHAEIIIFGLPHDVMHEVLNLIGGAVKEGRQFKAGDQSADFLDRYECAFVDFPLSAYEDFLGYARWFYKGNEFPAIQCVWPDSSGRFPWQPGAAEGVKLKQPLPGA
jgi:hypothetical protein